MVLSSSPHRFRRRIIVPVPRKEKKKKQAQKRLATWDYRSNKKRRLYSHREYRFLAPRLSAAALIIVSQKHTTKKFSAKQRKLQTKRATKVREGQHKRCCCDDRPQKTYLFCLADGVGIMVDCCVRETEKMKIGWNAGKSERYKEKWNWGKSGGDVPKINLKWPLNFFCKNSRACRAECQMNGFRSNGIMNSRL